MSGKVSSIASTPAVTPVKATQNRSAVTAQAVAAGVRGSGANTAKPAPPSGGKGATVTRYA